MFKANNEGAPATLLFTTIWFLESLMTQTFIVHLLRTERVPFLQSRAAWPLQLSSFGAMVVGIAICYVPQVTFAHVALRHSLTEVVLFLPQGQFLLQVNKTLKLEGPPPLYYAFLVATVAVYCATVQVFKYWYIKVFNSWL